MEYNVGIQGTAKDLKGSVSGQNSRQNLESITHVKADNSSLPPCMSGRISCSSDSTPWRYVVLRGRIYTHTVLCHKGWECVRWSQSAGGVNEGRSSQCCVPPHPRHVAAGVVTYFGTLTIAPPDILVCCVLVGERERGRDWLGSPCPTVTGF